MLVYIRSLGYGFIFDDRAQILLNPQVHSWNYLFRLLTTHVWSQRAAETFSSLYRPVFTVWLLIIYSLVGSTAWAWHAASLALYVLTTYLVYRLADELLQHHLAAALTALLFAVHPIHIEAVCWVSACNELLIGPLTAASLLLFLRQLRLDAQTVWSYRLLLSLLAWTAALFAGKERDTESGLDYFGARYYASNMGRWMSPDPSNLGVDIYLPQTWNRYNYAVNNPLTIKDANGLWPFYIHNQIINESFPGMSKQDLKGLQDASWNMDFGKGQQDPANSYEHGMSDGTTNQDPMVAQQMGDNYISQQVQTAQQAQADWEAQGHTGISPTALTAFGNALHTATDRTSPSHQGNQAWHNDPWYNKRTRTHVDLAPGTRRS